MTRDPGNAGDKYREKMYFEMPVRRDQSCPEIVEISKKQIKQDFKETSLIVFTDVTHQMSFIKEKKENQDTTELSVFTL